MKIIIHPTLTAPTPLALHRDGCHHFIDLTGTRASFITRHTEKIYLQRPLSYFLSSEAMKIIFSFFLFLLPFVFEDIKGSQVWRTPEGGSGGGENSFVSFSLQEEISRPISLSRKVYYSPPCCVFPNEIRAPHIWDLWNFLMASTKFTHTKIHSLDVNVFGEIYLKFNSLVSSIEVCPT